MQIATIEQSHYDGILDDDADVLERDDWREAIEPYRNVSIGTEISARNYRQAYGRPFRTLRLLAGLDESQCAELLGWTLGEVAAAEDRNTGFRGVQFLKVVQAMATLGFAVAARMDDNYGQRVWAPAVGEEFTPLNVERIVDYLRSQCEAWAERCGNRLL